MVFQRFLTEIESSASTGDITSLPQIQVGFIALLLAYLCRNHCILDLNCLPKRYNLFNQMSFGYCHINYVKICIVLLSQEIGYQINNQLAYSHPKWYFFNISKRQHLTFIRHPIHFFHFCIRSYKHTVPISITALSTTVLTKTLLVNAQQSYRFLSLPSVLSEH